MDTKFSKVTRKGAITIVTLSRPEVYNALHTDAHFELNKVFDDFSADPEQWVAIVPGAGCGWFSSRLYPSFQTQQFRGSAEARALIAFALWQIVGDRAWEDSDYRCLRRFACARMTPWSHSAAADNWESGSRGHPSQSASAMRVRECCGWPPADRRRVQPSLLYCAGGAQNSV